MHFKHITAALATLAIGGALAAPTTDADGAAIAARDDKKGKDGKDWWDDKKLMARNDDKHEYKDKKYKDGKKHKDHWDDKLKIRDDWDDKWDDKKLMARDDDYWRKNYNHWKDGVDDYFDDKKIKARDDDYKKGKGGRKGRHGYGDGYGRHGNNRWGRLASYDDRYYDNDGWD